MPPRRESSSGEQQGGDDEPEPTAGNFQVELDGKPQRQLLLLSDYVTTANVSNATFGWSLLARRATRGGGRGKQPAASAGGGLSKGGAGLGKAKAQPASSGGGKAKPAANNGGGGGSDSGVGASPDLALLSAEQKARLRERLMAELAARRSSPGRSSNHVHVHVSRMLSLRARRKAVSSISHSHSYCLNLVTTRL